jgi:AcrR family transcriptional regulator
MEHHEGPPMRRSPRQERGHQRVARILDAAEELFAREGYEAASTNQIAAQAGVPIGSLYQFFPNKEAILHAVTARYRAAGAEALAAALTPVVATLPASALAERLLGTMVAFGAARMGLTKIVLQAGANDRLAAAAAGIMAEATTLLAALLDARLPALPPARRALAARVALTAVMALLGVLTAEKAHGPAHSEALLAETHTLLAGYFAALDAAAAAVPAGDSIEQAC